MNNVFLHKAFAPDDRIGHVDEQGRVFETRFGPDKIVGRVDLRSGKIYESRSGKDEYLGKIDPTTGKIYLEKWKFL